MKERQTDGKQRQREAARTKTGQFRNQENMTMTKKYIETGRAGPQIEGPVAPPTGTHLVLASIPM